MERLTRSQVLTGLGASAALLTLPGSYRRTGIVPASVFELDNYFLAPGDSRLGPIASLYYNNNGVIGSYAGNCGLLVESNGQGANLFLYLQNGGNVSEYFGFNDAQEIAKWSQPKNIVKAFKMLFKLLHTDQNNISVTMTTLGDTGFNSPIVNMGLSNCVLTQTLYQPSGSPKVVRRANFSLGQWLGQPNGMQPHIRFHHHDAGSCALALGVAALALSAVIDTAACTLSPPPLDAICAGLFAAACDLFLQAMSKVSQYCQ